DTYDNWVATRKPPLFGSNPDARVSALAAEITDPGTARVLDIGAGTGRNALAMARRGHPVDAVELTPKFAEILRAEAYKLLLNVQ
ncbi:SAM-dependent methyltransferase, partial [Mycobacterium sp. ITM-2017-0098]